MTLALVRYEAARKALAEAKAIDEVKDIADKASAIQAYARQARNRQMEIDAAEMRIRAERRLGEMLQETPMNRGMSGTRVTGTKKEPVKDTTPTLTDMGLDKKLSSRSQKLAALPEDEFVDMLDEWRQRITHELDRVTTSLLKVVKRGDQEERQAQTPERWEKDGIFTKDLNSLVTSVSEGIIPPFTCLYVDPPWRYSNQGTRASTNNHYPTMTVDEIAALPVEKLSADNAHLHLWTTNAFLFECPKLFDAWGFEFKSSFVWVKTQIGIGNYWRNAHEFLLLGVRGRLTSIDKTLPSWLEVKRRAHSEKPEKIRALIQRLSPGPYLELFGRKWVSGWTVWGNERTSLL